MWCKGLIHKTTKLKLSTIEAGSSLLSTSCNKLQVRAVNYWTVVSYSTIKVLAVLCTEVTKQIFDVKFIAPFTVE